MTPEQEQVLALRESGLSRSAIATKLGITERAVKHRLERARAWVNADPQVAKTANDFGMADISQLDHYWRRFPTPDGGFVSGHFKNAAANDAPTQSFAETLIDNLKDYKPLNPILFAPRVNTMRKKEHILIVDLADTHFGKMATTTETGTEYNIEAARHRTIEGTKALLDYSSGFGIDRILFVMGNDILHTDNGKSTTGGTVQDLSGSQFQAYKAAQHASIDAIKECASVADVDLIHCMSNHDWLSGWGLSQTIAAEFRGVNGVRATEYNMSEIHRKYYGYERNAFMFTHGDGTKEEKIIGHFMHEAKPLVASCDHFYAFCHHYHHKIAKRRGVDVFQAEKDHNGMTAIVSGRVSPYGEGAKIEYVRSPSAPDGWHHRKGYMNRQGVECFAHHAFDGQRARFTEWF